MFLISSERFQGHGVNTFIEFIKMGSIDRRSFIKKLKEIIVGYEIDIMVPSLAIW